MRAVAKPSVTTVRRDTSSNPGFPDVDAGHCDSQTTHSLCSDPAAASSTPSLADGHCAAWPRALRPLSLDLQAQIEKTPPATWQAE
eukprot:8131852-Pyramimonas_sp.AAC.1